MLLVRCEVDDEAKWKRVFNWFFSLKIYINSSNIHIAYTYTRICTIARVSKADAHFTIQSGRKRHGLKLQAIAETARTCTVFRQFNNFYVIFRMPNKHHQMEQSAVCVCFFRLSYEN